MIDKKKALDDFLITEKEYDEMLSEFTLQADDAGQSIENALGEGKVAEAERFAHSLKGVSGNLRLDDCYRIAANMDECLKKGESVSAARLLNDFRKAVDEVRNSVTRP
jgi:HPt (histidine-containing phosphotransfer) domain-containing protein